MYIPSGASSTGDVSDRIRKLMSLSGDEIAGLVSVQPGDYVRTSSEGDAGISLAAPIGYDIWYLFHTKSILPFETGDDDERADQILHRLEPFLSKLQNIKPLQTLRNRNDLGQVIDAYQMRTYFENNGPRMIKEMRFETILKGKSLKYSSDGKPAEQYDNDSNLTNQVISYLAFPVGQLGVMEIASLISETMTEKDSFSIDEQEAIVEGLEMMPPIHNNRGHCIGTHLIEGGYLLQDKVEYPADNFTGQESIAPHQWLRHWIRGDDTWPVPGEFITMVVKPELYHVWWFQASMPFLYSGNWFGTEYYTSGIIQKVIKPDDKIPITFEDSETIEYEQTTEEVTSIYKVWVRCYELHLRPSDFYEFKKDERVAIIINTEEQANNFDWTRFEDRTEKSKIEWIPSEELDDPPTIKITCDPDLRIVPISFYEVE
jgi:hypothetical protein